MKFELLNKLLLEMPQQISVDLSMEKNVDYIRSSAKYVENIEIGDNVYEVYQIGQKDVELFFIHNNEIVAEIGYALYGKGIEENLIIQKETYKGLIRYLYINYLLKNFKFIISDSTMTREGFNFWVKLYNEYKNQFSFYIFQKSKKKTYYIHSIEDMNKVFGINEKNHDYHFVIENK